VATEKETIPRDGQQPSDSSRRKHPRLSHGSAKLSRRILGVSGRAVDCGLLYGACGFGLGLGEATRAQEVNVMDIDKLRDGQIRLHQLDNVDARYTFYHDETNNLGKLHIGVHGLNVAELNVFVLGGVVHAGEPRPINIEPLREAMHLHQKSADEIKFKHVAKGRFPDLLQSPRLTTFLRWITDNGLMIHYHELDPLYWSTVDIVDSILPKLDNPMLIVYHALLKSDLITVLRCDLPATIGLFHRCGYPTLTPDHREPFLTGILELLERNSTILPQFNHYMLKGILQAGRKLDSLVFIEHNTPNVLIENLAISYLNRIALFKYAHHIFDMENLIHKHLMNLSSSSGLSVTNYRFADSKVETGIQLSDIVVGLLGKMHSYFTETTDGQVVAARASLTGVSLQNAELLRDLISTSHDVNVGFLHHVSSGHDLRKLDMFLRFHDGEYAD
jgi:hypothetical protein